MNSWRITPISAEQAYPLRKAVLRDGTRSSRLDFDEDDLDSTFHLGAFGSHTDPVGIATWILRRHPDLCVEPGYQLRGMATDPLVRGTGAGRALLAAGIERCVEHGAGMVWAKARLTALDFYTAAGFTPRGRVYHDLATGLDHQDIVMDLLAS